MQGGEEFARTKHGDHNTYRGPLDAVTRLDLDARTAQLDELVQYYHGLLEIRKAFPELSGMAGDRRTLHFVHCRGGLIGFCARAPEDESLPGRLVVYYKPVSAPASVAALPGRELALSVRWLPVPPPNPLAPPAAMPSNSPPGQRSDDFEGGMSLRGVLCSFFEKKEAETLNNGPCRISHPITHPQGDGAHNIRPYE